MHRGSHQRSNYWCCPQYTLLRGDIPGPLDSWQTFGNTQVSARSFQALCPFGSNQHLSDSASSCRRQVGGVRQGRKYVLTTCRISLDFSGLHFRCFTARVEYRGKYRVGVKGAGRTFPATLDAYLRESRWVLSISLRPFTQEKQQLLPCTFGSGTPKKRTGRPPC